MKVGDLVTVMVGWGGSGTLALVAAIRQEMTGAGELEIVTLHNGWEYHPWELEVVSAGR